MGKINANSIEKKLLSENASVRIRFSSDGVNVRPGRIDRAPLSKALTRQLYVCSIIRNNCVLKLRTAFLRVFG